jgi:DNA-binding MarR family transcriptional regulator
MDKLEYFILDYLINTCHAEKRITAVTKKTILGEIKISKSHLNRKLALLEEAGYIKKGIKAGKEYTYYATESGKNILREANE